MAFEEGLRERFEGELECDETTFGWHRKGKRGWGAAGEVIVFGIIKRNGVVRASAIDGRSKALVCIRFRRTPRAVSTEPATDFRLRASSHYSR